MNEPTLRSGWRVILAGLLCVFACIGLSRLAIGMLLPAMSTDLSLSYSQMGQLGGANFLGYLVAVMVSGNIVSKVGYRLTVTLALGFIGATILLISRSHHFTLILMYYTLTGIGSGIANVAIMALVSSWFGARLRGRATGFIVIGNGFAMILAGGFFPVINQNFGASGWRYSWIIVALTVFLVAIVCYLMIQPPAPEETSHVANDAAGKQNREEDLSVKRDILKLAGVYFLFGVSHSTYLTFIVTTLVSDHHFAEARAGIFWAFLGAISLISGPFFGLISDRFIRKLVISGVFAVQAIAYAIIASHHFPLLSVGLFGVVCWAIPSVVAALVADIVPSARTAIYYGKITFAFSIGQIIGPMVVGQIAEITHSFSGGYAVTTTLTVIAGLITLSIGNNNRNFRKTAKEVKKRESAYAEPN